MNFELKEEDANALIVFLGKLPNESQSHHIYEALLTQFKEQKKDEG